MQVLPDEGDAASVLTAYDLLSLGGSSARSSAAAPSSDTGSGRGSLDAWQAGGGPGGSLPSTPVGGGPDDAAACAALLAGARSPWPGGSPLPPAAGSASEPCTPRGEWASLDCSAASSRRSSAEMSHSSHTPPLSHPLPASPSAPDGLASPAGGSSGLPASPRALPPRPPRAAAAPPAAESLAQLQLQEGLPWQRLLQRWSGQAAAARAAAAESISAAAASFGLGAAASVAASARAAATARAANAAAAAAERFEAAASAAAAARAAAAESISYAASAAAEALGTAAELMGEGEDEGADDPHARELEEMGVVI